jgi:hypothetical protein
MTADRDREAFIAELERQHRDIEDHGDGTVTMIAGCTPRSSSFVLNVDDLISSVIPSNATHARAQAGEPVAAASWTREDLAAGLAELDGIELVPPLQSVVDLEYLNRADDLLTFLSVASVANQPLGTTHPAPAQEPVAVPAGGDDYRSAFEKVAAGDGLNVHSFDHEEDMYDDSETQWCWQGWRECLKFLRYRAALQPAGEG